MILRMRMGLTHGWIATSIAVAGDNNTRVPWTNPTTGACNIWLLNLHGSYVSNTPGFGPYTGWTATDIATGSGDLTRMLWNNTSRQAGVWTINDAGARLDEQSYGPY